VRKIWSLYDADVTEIPVDKADMDDFAAGRDARKGGDGLLGVDDVWQDGDGDDDDDESVKTDRHFRGSNFCNRSHPHLKKYRFEIS
jgi:hypothetical protein